MKQDTVAPVTQQMLDTIRQMTAAGKSARQIGKHLGVGTARINRLLVVRQIKSTADVYTVWTTELAEKFKRLTLAGVPIGELAKELSISKETVRMARQRFGVNPPRESWIASQTKRVHGDRIVCTTCMVEQNKIEFRQLQRRRLICRTCVNKLTTQYLHKAQPAAGHLCAVCSKPATCIDHKHSPGIHPGKAHDGASNRGYLCNRCNSGLGAFRDSEVLLRAGAKHVTTSQTPYTALPKPSSAGHGIEKTGQYLWSTYGIRTADVEQMKATQNNCCLICKIDMLWGIAYKKGRPSGDQAVVDHCHTTGKIRGLLCRRCNLGNGHFEDNAELLLKAADYLENPPGVVAYEKPVRK